MNIQKEKKYHFESFIFVTRDKTKKKLLESKTVTFPIQKGVI